MIDPRPLCIVTKLLCQSLVEDLARLPRLVGATALAALLAPSVAATSTSNFVWGAALNSIIAELTGPTAVALKHVGPWTYGALVNHIWSFAGDDDHKGGGHA